MVSELVVRAGRHDESWVADLLTQRGSPFHRPSMSRLVVDVTNATETETFFNAAQSAGIPFVVDPMTVLTQGPVREGDRWLRLPYAQQEPVAVTDLTARLDQLVEEVVQAQLEASATVIVPPYFVVDAPGTPAFELSIRSVQLTAEYCRANGIALKLMPILCAQIKSFGPENTWRSGIDRFAARIRDFELDAVAACLGPAGNGDDSVAKVTNVFATMLRLQQLTGSSVIAWRQGVLGPGLVAAGVAGYECGAGIGEQAKPTDMKNARAKQGGGPGGIYLEPFGRSLPYTPARVLLGNISMRPKVMCDVESCCPTVTATLDNTKPHSIRSRARQLDRLDRQPHSAWRLNDVATGSRAAHTLAQQANRILKQEYAAQNIERGSLIHPKTFESLSTVCTAISRQRQAS